MLIDDLSSQYCIEKELVEKYINRLETKNTIKRSVEQNKTDEDNVEAKPKVNRKLLFEKMSLIETKMCTIEQKVEHIISIITK